MLLPAAALFGDGHDYTVETREGVPFICIDGNPVRGRMFYGNVPGTKYIYADETLRSFEIKFTAKRDDRNAQVRLNFGAPVREIRISEMSLLDVADNSSKSLYDFSASPVDPNLKSNWTHKALEAWRDTSEKTSDVPPDAEKYKKPPYSAKNKNGVLYIEKEFVDTSLPKNQGKIHDIERLNFYIGNIGLKKGREYRLNFKLQSDKRGRFDAIVYTKSPFEILTQTAGETFMTQEKFAAERGIDFVTFGVPAFWKDDGSYEKLVDSRFKPVIGANPNVKIIVRLGLEPPNEWLDSHKDSVMCNFDGTPIERMHVRFPTPSSQDYRRDAIDAMKKFIKYVEKNYPENIAGYHPSGGNSSEWFYGGTFQEGLNGYDPSTLKAWRKWLQKKYGDDKSLRAAWNSATASISDARVPSPEERNAGESALLDPQKSANVIDFNLFLQDEMADMVLLAAKTVRETAPRKRLSVMFYGYGFGFSSTPKGPAYSGHYAFDRLLKSDCIDIFTSPIDYVDRLFAEAKICTSAAESAPLAGKLWLDEDDNRTYLAPDSGSPPYVLDKMQKTAADSVKVLERNMAQQIVRNNASWWMDLFGCGWFLDAEFWKLFDVFKNAELEMIKKPTLFRPETAVSYDERSMCHIAGNSVSAMTSSIVNRARRVLSRTGTPFGQYLIDDILEGRAQPKLNYFLGAYALTGQQRRNMGVVRGKSACVFAWTPAYVDFDARRFSLGAVEEATGFKVEDAGDTEAWCIPTEAGKREGLCEFGFRKKIKPLLSPVPQNDDEILAVYTNGKPAVVLRNSGKHPQMFLGATVLPKEICSLMARKAGVHVYADNDTVAYANGKYLSLNATKNGICNVDLGREADVFDVIADKPLGRAKTLKFDFKRGDVKLLMLSQ